MLVAFFILSPLGILALIGFARRVHPITGHIAGHVTGSVTGHVGGQINCHISRSQ
jgi:hypothetical protein